jgi:4-hydroxy-3-methylbut-2-enyl diphosphate reductase
VGVHSHETRDERWLPGGHVTLGLTAGASTPNNVVGEVIEKILALRGHRSEELSAA